MATRSKICILYPGMKNGNIDKDEPNTLKYIYCHFDGYFEHVGRILSEYYTDLKRIEELIELGDISSLGELLYECEQPDWFDSEQIDEPKLSVTVAYGRDRGERNTHAGTMKIYSSFYDESDNIKSHLLQRIVKGSLVEYVYVFDVLLNKWIMVAVRSV
jgi:hypothetical protein